MNKKLNGIIKRLRKFNKWRRGDISVEFHELNISPRQIGEDIDFVCDYLEEKREIIKFGELHDNK